MMERSINYQFSNERFGLDYSCGTTCATLKIKDITGNLAKVLLDEQELQELDLSIREILKMFPTDP